MISEDHTEGIASEARVGSGGICVVGALHAVLSQLHTFERSVRKVRIRGLMSLRMRDCGNTVAVCINLDMENTAELIFI